MGVGIQGQSRGNPSTEIDGCEYLWQRLIFLEETAGLVVPQTLIDTT